MAERRRGFGHIRKLPSGRYQASYIVPKNAVAGHRSSCQAISMLW